MGVGLRKGEKDEVCAGDRELGGVGEDVEGRVGAIRLGLEELKRKIEKEGSKKEGKSGWWDEKCREEKREKS